MDERYRDSVKDFDIKSNRRREERERRESGRDGKSFGRAGREQRGGGSYKSDRKEGHKNYKSDTGASGRKDEDMVFGIRAIIEAIRSGREIDKIMMKNDMQGELAYELMQTVKGTEIQIQRVPEERLNRIKRGNHQGAIAFVAQTVYYKLEEIVQSSFEAGKDPLIVLLDGITDVRNFGAIARTLECAGADAVVIPSRGSVGVGADAIKTSAGALHTLPVCKVKNLLEAVKYLKQSGIKVVSATEKAEKSYTDVPLTGPLAIVMGAEDVGVSNDVIKQSDELLSIPIFGNIASLNVSVACGIMVYEVVRQRNFEQAE